MAYVIRILGAEGPITEQHGEPAGLYLSALDVDAYDGLGYAAATRVLDNALRFPTYEAAFEAWRQQSRVRPLRPDGKPNRPATAFSVTFDRVDDADLRHVHPHCTSGGCNERCADCDGRVA
jgi:hypothetical protein